MRDIFIPRSEESLSERCNVVPTCLRAYCTLYLTLKLTANSNGQVGESESEYGFITRVDFP